MLHVKVNATSANVCVGFDVLGLALDLANNFTFEKSDEFSFVGFEDAYSNVNNNLVYDAYVELFKYLNLEPIRVQIGYKGEIPVSRGLGSSSSLIVAGMMGANAMAGYPLAKDEVFNLCAKMEGHPDNVAPAVYGGLVASYNVNGDFKAINYEVSNKLKFFVIIPPFKISTNEARGVLPKSLSYSELVHNMSRIVNLPKAFSDGDIKLLNDLFDDRIHEPYRSKLIKGYDEIKRVCTENNSVLAISGSGSTMLVISYEDSIVDKLIDFGYEVKALEIGSGAEIKEV